MPTEIIRLAKSGQRLYIGRVTSAARNIAIPRIALFLLRTSLPIIAIGVSLALYYSTSFYYLGDFVYNSDSLYLPSLYADVTRGANLSQWNLPPSSYVFPDMLLYFGARSVTPNIEAAAVLFGISQYLGLAFGLVLLALQTLPYRYRSLSASVIALMSVCFILSVPNLEFYNQMVFVSAHHFGVVLIVLYVLVITHRLIAETRINHLLVGVLGGLSFLTTLSDWLYLVQVVLPLSAVLALLLGIKAVERKRFLAVAGALIVPSLLGLIASLVNILNHPSLTKYVFDPHPIAASLTQLVDALAALPIYESVLMIIFLSFSAFALGETIVLRRASARYSAGGLVPIYFFLAFLANALVVIGFGLFSDRDALRYFLPVLIFSGFWGLPLVVAIPITAKQGFLEWGAMGALGVGIFLSWGGIDWHGFDLSYYPPFIECIDQQTAALGIRNGIGNYWQARPISLLSHNDLHVSQVNRDLSPYDWINNSGEYALAPEFAVIDTSFPEDYPFRLDENLIVKRFGQPDVAFQCERAKVLVYRSNESFRMLFGDSHQK